MKIMNHGVVVLLMLLLGLCLSPAYNTAALPESSPLSSENKKASGENRKGGHIRITGLLDKLMDPESKERKLLEGASTVLSAAGDIDYESERTIGESLALEGFRRYGMPVDNPELQQYVNLVGVAVARNSQRPSIPYVFVVVDSPLQNAFSCPGGIIFISQGLLTTIQDEAQLACILAHEVAHVGHKHALKSIKRARFFKGVGKITSATMAGEKGKQFESMIGDLQNILFDKGLDQNMEFEADMSGMKTAYRTGYDPRGMLQVLQRLRDIEAQSRKQGSWFSTHPPLTERIKKCETQLNQYPDAAQLTHERDRFNARVR
ncbi:MAG: M48 family metalloprotease [Desulfatiglandaceae bacterium]